MAQKSGGKASKFARSLERGGAARGPEESSEEITASATSTTQEAQTGERSRGRQRPEKPVRITVDLDSNLHHYLRRYAADEGVRGTEVVRGLLEMLEEDPELASRLSDRLMQSGK